MNQIIPFEQHLVGDAKIKTVDGRHIHKFLGIGKEYAHWVKLQIKRGRFVENQDYIVFALEGKNPQGGRPSQEYHFTIEAAKCVGMLSATTKGDEIRQYFLECEKHLLTQPPLTLPAFHNPQTKMLIETLMRIDVLEAEQASQKDLIIATQQEALKAQEIALTALRSQQWVSIRQYCYVHDLAQQMPLAAQKSYARFLGDYSREHGIPMYKAPTADVAWPDERTYHVQAIHDTLGPWLQRQASQSVFLVPPQHE